VRLGARLGDPAIEVLKSLPPGALAIVVAVIWGLCFVVIQASLPGAPPLLLAGLRTVIGGGVLVGWMVFTRGSAAGRGRGTVSAPPDARHPCLPSLPLLLTLALTNATLALGAMYLAAGRTEASIASILAGSQPLLLAAAGVALFGERGSVQMFVGLAVAMTGVVLVATASTGAMDTEGIALASLAAIAPSIGTVVMRRLGATIDLLATTSAQFLLGGLMLLGASAVLEGWSGSTWGLTVVAETLLLGVLGTGLAYVAWFWLLGRMPLASLGAILFLVPVVGVITGILAGDRLAPSALLGTMALLAGIGLTSIPRRAGNGHVLREVT